MSGTLPIAVEPCVLEAPGAKAADIRTEVFLLPAAGAVEKEGSIVSSGRWMQWQCATKPLGQSLPDTDMLTQLGGALNAACARGGVKPEPIVHLQWDYGQAHPDVHAVAKEINGRFLAGTTAADGRAFEAGGQVPSFMLRRDDGTTTMGELALLRVVGGPGQHVRAPRSRGRAEQDRSAPRLGVSGQLVHP